MEVDDFVWGQFKTGFCVFDVEGQVLFQNFALA